MRSVKINIYSTQSGSCTVFHDTATVLFRRARGFHTPAAWIVSPTTDSGLPPLISIHGITRSAETMANLLANGAGRTGRVVICPLFDSVDYRRYQRFEGKVRSDHALLRLVDSLADEGIIPKERFDLAGFSGGAQFAHRFTWLYPHRVGRLTVSSAGWYTFPDDEHYPFGMGDVSKGGLGRAFCLKSNLVSFLDREIVVLVGAHDDNVDAMTRSSPQIDTQQGRDRLTRARRWSEAITQSAIRLGIAPRIDFRILPGCGHDFAECINLAGLDSEFLGESRTLASIGSGVCTS